MNKTDMTGESAEVRFARLVELLRSEADVTPPGSSGNRGFGSGALKVNGSIFAMLTGSGQFVVKLSRERVSALIQQGVGCPFDAGKGRPMKEWLTVTENDNETWLTLAREALAYVRGRRS